ncbi:MAG: DNA polymerase Y family protein [Actinomycetota bacterium]|nr:DNA polymerase Y family protein [Actinomycetota bacterium]
MTVAPVRTLVVWCPDWPVTAARLTASDSQNGALTVPFWLPEGPDAVAVVFANRVVACSAAARSEGVRRGLRRREAQGRCPDLVVVENDPARDARAFEPVVVALEAFAPRVEIVRPGVCAVATRGPSRYFGGDEALAARVELAVTERVPGAGCRVGVADGPFAAGLAARGGVVVAPGESPTFLAPFPVGVLERPELADLLVRLGIRTLGTFAALPGPDVLARFGPEGALAHRLARGLDERPPAGREAPPDLAVEMELDPPAERVDTAAFAAKALADELHQHLAGRGLACTRIAIEAQTEHGESLSRLWRHDGTLTPAAMADRVRWQLDGWLSGTSASAETPTAGLTLIRLVPDQLVPGDGRQLDFWGGAAEVAARAARALARVQGVLGPGAVVTAVRSGGRGPAEQVTLVPWGEPPPSSSAVLGAPASGFRRQTHRELGREQEAVPWPGRVPSPSPATVFMEPVAAQVLDASGVTVGVSGRGVVTAPPARVSVAGGAWDEVVAWAGPWPVDERWWDAPAHRRRARFQVVTADGSAWLLGLEAGRWWADAAYD